MVAILVIIAFAGMWTTAGRQAWDVGAAVLVIGYVLSLSGLVFAFIPSIRNAINGRVDKPTLHIMFTQGILVIAIFEVVTAVQILSNGYRNEDLGEFSSLIVTACGAIFSISTLLTQLIKNRDFQTTWPIVCGSGVTASCIFLPWLAINNMMLVYALCPFWLWQFIVIARKFSLGNKTRFRFTTAMLTLIIIVESILTVTGTAGWDP